MIRSKKIVIFTFSTILLSPFQAGPVRLYGQEAGQHTPLDVSIPQGWIVIEGDILIRIDGPEGVFATNFWTNGIVPYEFDSNVNATNQTRMLAAMAEWEAVADVQFVARSGHSNYIHIQDSTVNQAAVGMQGGKQLVEIYNWNRRFIMAHELGHALGLWHEQSRSDRDTYITIETDRIQSSKEHNFDKHDEADVYGPYDFNSVMHYSQCAFSCCNLDTNPCCTAPCSCSGDPNACRTITVKSPWDTEWQSAIGQRTSFSFIDQLTMSFLYPESDWVFVNEFYSRAPRCGGSPLGTFLSPYCSFPSGASAVPVSGTVIIQPGTYSSVGVYTKAMTLRAPLGDVILGP